VFVGLVFQSCLEDPNAEQFADLSNLFEINLEQSLGEVRTIELGLELNEQKNCEDVFINSSLLETTADIILEISSIEIPSDCADELHTITKLHPINSDLGVYNFNLQLAGTDASMGRINITANKVMIDFDTVESISEGELSIFRIHDGHMWGYLDINAPQSTMNSIKTDLFGNLETLQISPPKSPGFYGPFKILENNSIVIANAPINSSVFHAEYTAEDWIKLEQNVNEVLQNPNYQGVKIKITNELGEVLGNE